MIRRVVLIAGLVLAAAAGPLPAAAASDPGAEVTRLGNQGLAALAPGVSPAEREARFRQLFIAHFDIPAISRFVLGRYWRIASGPQREEFTETFTRYITKVYSDQLAPYGGGRLVVTGTRPDPAGALVTSRLERPNGKPVEIDWQMTGVDGGYKISDVTVDGVSMAATQRSQFAAVIQRNGGQVGSLIAAMRDKLGGAGSNLAGAPPQTGNGNSAPRRAPAAAPTAGARLPDYNDATRR